MIADDFGSYCNYEIKHFVVSCYHDLLQVTRYPTVNKKLVLPIQVAGLIDSDNPQMVSKMYS